MSRQKHARVNSKSENTFKVESTGINDSLDFGKN